MHTGIHRRFTRSAFGAPEFFRNPLGFRWSLKGRPQDYALLLPRAPVVMLVVIICFCALWIPGLVILIASARRAPVGFEDETGFHQTPEKPHVADIEPPKARAS